MFARLAKNSLFKRIIAVFIILQFVASSVVTKGYAAAGNLRPQAARKDNNRLGQIRRSLDTLDLNRIGKAESVSKKDGGDAVIQDPFKAILGEYAVSATVDNLAFGTFVQQQIDLDKSPEAKTFLANNFGDINSGDSFFNLYYQNIPLAIVKKDKAGQVTIKKIAEDISSIPLNIVSDDAEKLKGEGITSADILARDFLILEKRASIPVAERMTIEFAELRDYVYELARKIGQQKAIEQSIALVGENATKLALLQLEWGRLGKEEAKAEGLRLAGGKGLSLSVMSRVVDVPPGLNVTTTAYFKFVKDNKQVWDKIFNELQTLDTMDDQKRDVVTSEIRDVMKNAPVPEDIKAEVTAMYHQLSVLRFLAGKPSPAPVAVRSSGTKEDIHVKTWLPVSTGSQAGQSDTFLNVKGERDVLDKLRADFASLFTDRAVSYRDDATFLQFSGAIDFQGKTSQDVYWGIVTKLREYAKKLDRPEYNVYADLMSKVTSPNPGSVNLMSAMEEILKQESNPEMANALAVLKKKAEEVVHPEQIGIDVVIMQMVQSYLSGVLFTVNPATKMAGVAQSLYKAWYQNDDSLVYRDAKTGSILGTRPIVTSFDVAFGYGENVVGGKVNPDKFIMGTYNGQDWFVIEKRKGNKLINMKDVEKAIELLSHKISEKDQRALANTVKEAIAYDEVGKRINGILATKLHGVKYLKRLEGKEENDKDKKARVQTIANEIADMVKGQDSEAEVIAFIKDKFVVESRKGYPGIQEAALSGVVREVFEKVQQAQVETDRGMNKLAQKLGDLSKADAFIHMVKEVWENKDFDLPQRQAVLDKLGLTLQEQRDLSYLFRALIDSSFTANRDTTVTHQNTFTMTDDQAQYVARMGWAITQFYKDARDIEFAIEIDKTAPSDKALKLYVVDDSGNFQGMDEKGKLFTVNTEAEKARIKEASLRLYNVQARPYTAEYLKVDVIRARTEADEKWLEENAPKAIASGTKGENATHGYVLVFDPNKDVAWHAQQIYRLKAGDFTPEERAQIVAIGFNPDEYGTGKDKQLPIILYLLEADPNHDPIMRLVNSVVTIRGGDTCHAAIFCREQGIPAVTGAGKVILQGDLLKTGKAITVDANNGNIYELAADIDARIPINFVKFKIKPYGIPGDDDNMPYPGIGQIIAAASAAQQNSPIMLAVDAVGNSLTRAEFKGEEIGINVYAGYGHYLLQQIKEKKAKRPSRVLISDLYSGKAGVSIKFIDSLNSEAAQAFIKSPEATELFRKTFGRNYNLADGLTLLKFFDLQKDILLYGHAAIEKTMSGEDGVLLKFVPILPQNVFDVLEYLYGASQRRLNYDYNIITDLESHPWILKEVDAKLAEKGYSNFKDYVTSEFLYFYNLMGFTIAPDQTAKNRAYDFAQDKIRGMPGSEVFSWPGVNPLVGLRGTSLEIEAFDEDFGGNQLVLDFLFDSVIQAHQGTKNQAWFYVFVRSTRELDTLDKIIEYKAKQAGKLPKEIGIMIEVPSAALVAGELAGKMAEMEKKYAKYGVQHTFFSFGTNDYSHLAGMGDREDPRMKLDIQDPAAKAAIPEMKSSGYYYDEASKRLPLIDEGADVMIQLMEAVVASANDKHVATSLCGEAITALVNRGDYESAGRIMALLDSFGVSMMKVRLAASMTRVDTMAATKEITVAESGRTMLVDLSSGEVRQKKGIIKGEIIFVNSADDLVPDALKGLQGPELTKEKDMLKLQSLESARSTMRTFNKVVVITKNLVAQQRSELIGTIGEATFTRFVNEGLLKDIGNGLYVWTNLGAKAEKFNQELTAKGFSETERKAIEGLWQKAWDNTIEGLERRDIDWDDLQYAKAIIVDADVNLEGWDVFRKDKSIIPTRVKALAKGIGAQRASLEGKFVTIDYAAKKVYDGNLAVKKIEAKLRRLPIPQVKPQVEVQAAVAEDANNAYKNIKYHPKAILAFENNNLGELNKLFDEYAGKLVEEVEKVTQESDTQKRTWLLGKLQNKVKTLTEPVIKKFMLGVLDGAEKDGKVVLAKSWVVDLRKAYFSDMEAGIKKLLAGKSAEQFIKDAFKESMLDALRKNPGKLVIHKMTTVNCVEFNDMAAGFLVEQINPNRNYGLLGAARAIGDMWLVNRMELAAFKEVWEGLPVDQRKNFGLQITDLKGTQSGAVMIAWREVLKDMNIIPGVDGLMVGVNIATPADTLAVDKYFEYFKNLGTGLSFISYDTMKLGAAWAGVDIFWTEWRRLAKEEELLKFGNTAAWIAEAKIEKLNGKVVVFDQQLAAQTNLKDGGLVEKTEISAQVLEHIRLLDESVYRVMSQGFGNFVNSLQGLTNSSGGLIIGANTVLENAGTLAAVKKIKSAQPELKIVFWAKDKLTASKLKTLGTESISDTVIAESLTQALKALKDLQVENNRIVLVNSDLDNKDIKEEFQVKDIPEFLSKPEVKGIRIVGVHAASTFAGGESINPMPLVLARATAAVYKDEGQVVKQYEKLSANSGLSEDTLKALNDLDQEFATVPLVKVSEDIAKAQITYEETISKI
jgi:phosphoenolpyruvate synthase/pyruvate phosphate dikinase